MLGQHLREAGRADEALIIHRRSEAVCGTGIAGERQELLGLYLASIRQHIGNDLAALHRWSEAEPPLRYALAYFEDAKMPAWSEPARLDLGIVLRHLAHHDEAHETLTAAHDALVGLNNPRRTEAAAQLHALGSRATCRPQRRVRPTSCEHPATSPAPKTVSAATEARPAETERRADRS